MAFLQGTQRSAGSVLWHRLPRDRGRKRAVREGRQEGGDIVRDAQGTGRPPCHLPGGPHAQPHSRLCPGLCVGLPPWVHSQGAGSRGQRADSGGHFVLPSLLSPPPSLHRPTVSPAFLQGPPSPAALSKRRPPPQPPRPPAPWPGSLPLGVRAACLSQRFLLVTFSSNLPERALNQRGLWSGQFRGSLRPGGRGWGSGGVWLESHGQPKPRGQPRPRGHRDLAQLRPGCPDSHKPPSLQTCGVLGPAGCVSCAPFACPSGPGRQETRPPSAERLSPSGPTGRAAGPC